MEENEESEELEKKNPRLSQQQKTMIESLKLSGGNVSRASEMNKTSRAIHYVWMENNPKYAERAVEVTEMTIDLVESKLMQNVNDRVQRSIEYYLDAKAKHRGYGQAKSLTVDVKEPIKITDVSDTTLKEKLQELGIGTEVNQLDGKRDDKQ